MTSNSETEAHGSRLTSKEKLWLVGVLLLTLLTFASTFTFGWVYDDPPQIPGNADLRWDRLGFLFTHHLWSSANGITEARFYRPLLAFWFLLNKTLLGLNPHWFHLTTVLAHVLATALAFLVARRLLSNPGAAFLSAAVFGLHPLQAESASWISSVNDSLAAALCFASFLSCRKARSERQHPAFWWILSAVCFLLALLTKEVSAVLPAIVLVDVWLGSRTAAKQESLRDSGAVVVAIFGLLEFAWLLLRRHVLGQVATAHSSIGWGTIFLTAPKVVLFQLYRALLPLGLSPHYDFGPADPHAIPQSLLPLFFVIVLAAVAWRVARKSPQLWIAYAWLLLPLAPTLNLRWMNEGDFIHDRYMYMSMFAVGLLVAAAYDALKQSFSLNYMIPAMPVILMVALALASALQSQFWANDVYLFSRAVQVAPQNEWAHLNYGAALSTRERYADAAPHFVRSFELRAGWLAANDAGFAFQKSGNLAQAERWYRVALEMNPSLAEAWFGMGQIRLEQREPATALALFKQALSLKPDAEGYHYALGLALEQLSQNAAALEAYQTELRLHPDHSAARSAIDRLSSAAGHQ